MSSRQFYVFLTFVGMTSTIGWLFIRNVEYIRESWLQTYFDLGAVVGYSLLLYFFIQTYRGKLSD